MDMTIDRTSYRRSKKAETERTENRALSPKEGTAKGVFYQEIIVSMAILIGVLGIKLVSI